MYGYGLVFFGCYALMIPLQNSAYKKAGKWNFWMELLFITVLCLIAWWPTFLYYRSGIVNGDFSFRVFSLTVYLPTLAILFPLILFGRWILTKVKFRKGIFLGILKEDDATDYEHWKKKIDRLINEEVFLDTNLTQHQMAKMLETNSSVLSKVINTGYGLNFNDFINKSRIDYVLKRIEQGEHKVLTLSGISAECGFKSKATFNRAFKKRFNMSPTEYIKRQLTD